uniref:Uncharacterized protein n=1 Tax=Desertifilum tharense IPPAS B-1220 TaxID=1781255 RepID=A0A1E5QQ88_9CYAN|nr:hypothetical protein BH720_02240 [Desertifilum tharense IPPAS B-1220]
MHRIFLALGLQLRLMRPILRPPAIEFKPCTQLGFIVYILGVFAGFARYCRLSYQISLSR